MAYYLMLNRRDDWGQLHSYRYGKVYKDMKQAISRCRKIMDSYVLDQKNVCIFINTSSTRMVRGLDALETRMVKPISSPSPILSDSSDFL